MEIMVLQVIGCITERGDARGYIRNGCVLTLVPGTGLDLNPGISVD